MVTRRTSRARRGLTAEKVMQLLTGRDYFDDGTAYGRDDQRIGTAFDEESARRDWESCKVFLLAEFESANPGKVCYAASHFDNVSEPDEQPAGFSGFKIDEILNLFPIGV